MLKLFKPKKRVTISDIKIPIPMLAGIENATNLTEEQIDLFLRGGKLNIPVEQQKQQQNILPVILNEKIKHDESSIYSDYSSDSENDEDIIVDFLQKLSTEAQKKDERTLIPKQDPPPEPSIPMMENQNPDAVMNKQNDQINKPEESVKEEQPPHNSSSTSTLEVAPTPQKQEKKRAEQYQEKINFLKYQLEQAQQQYYNEHQAHLRFVKERESMDHHILHQISLVKQRLHHVLHQRSMGGLRTSRSYHALMKEDAEEPQGEWQHEYRLEKGDKEFYDAQRKDMVTHKRIYNDDEQQQRWIEDCYRYYYYRKQLYNYYNKKSNDYYWDDYRYEPRYIYYGSKEADEREENAYYQYRAWR